MVALHLGDMIGLGCSEQHLLDSNTLKQPQNNSAMSVTKAFQDRIESMPRVLEYLAARKESAENVHEHHLSRVVAEMPVIKRHHDFGFVGFESSFHQSSQRAVGTVFKIVRNIEWGEPHVGVFHERTGVEEAARLQKAEPVLVTCSPQVLSIKFMGPLGVAF